MYGMLRSVCNVWLLTYRGAFVISLSIFDWKACNILVLDGLPQPHSSIPSVHVGFSTVLFWVEPWGKKITWRKFHGPNNAFLILPSNEDAENDDNRMTENCTDRKMDRLIDLFLLYLPTTHQVFRLHRAKSLDEGKQWIVKDMEGIFCGSV